jgi:hypothetical protein
MLETEIKLLIEKKFGRTIRYPKDCEELAQMMRENFDLVISASTLKRLWGFYKETEAPRLYSLDTLAKFLGFENWDQMDARLVVNTSEFEDLVSIDIKQLTHEETLVVEYSPSRKLLLKYQTDFTFEVLESTTNKILVGDTLRIYNMVKNYPLICHSVVRGNEEKGKYIGGKNEGITYLCVVNKTTKANEGK